MHSTIALAATMSAISASAMALPAVSEHLATRADTTGQIVAYVDANYSGYNEFIAENLNTCYNFDPQLAGQISSIAISRGDVCYFYSDYDCANQSDYFSLAAPGSKDLSKVGLLRGVGTANDVARSFLCTVTPN